MKILDAVLLAGGLLLVANPPSPQAPASPLPSTPPASGNILGMPAPMPAPAEVQAVFSVNDPRFASYQAFLQAFPNNTATPAENLFYNQLQQKRVQADWLAANSVSPNTPNAVAISNGYAAQWALDLNQILPLDNYGNLIV